MGKNFAVTIIVFSSMLFLLGILHGITYGEFNFSTLLSNLITIFLMVLMIRKESKNKVE